ncbi:hypothetical protein [Streptomyces sp. OM5714]|uniref:hypothetical protein n=1 Tax=Streptomyces sp. OM5714 TaxID=2602736 RepID=UPI001A045EBE|nr:hypothetical protein [Streptomyces sp. OM5714]KAF2774863.1 hypothetical protein STPH1_7050 [Streptomyces sp. OM5714]
MPESPSSLTNPSRPGLYGHQRQGRSREPAGVRVNGSRTHYRRSPVLVSHPAGRPCTDPSCLCLSRTADEGHAARSGSPADRYEAWMIHTRNYQLVSLPDRPDVPSGISLDAPVLRKRVLRTATLSPDAQHLMDLWNALMGGA